MNICLIGSGIPCLILANILTNKNIKISIFEEYKSKNNSIVRQFTNIFIAPNSAAHFQALLQLKRKYC